MECRSHNIEIFRLLFNNVCTAFSQGLEEIYQKKMNIEHTEVFNMWSSMNISEIQRDLVRELPLEKNN